MISALNGKTVSALSGVAAAKTSTPTALRQGSAGDAAVVQISSDAKALAQSSAPSDVSSASSASGTSGAKGAPSGGPPAGGPPPGGKPPGGAPPAGGGGGAAGGSSKTKAAASDPADTNGDGTVSAAEQAIYDLTHTGAAATAGAQNASASATSDNSTG